MPLTLIHGVYRIVGASPDGDSIRFYPTDPGVWARAGISVHANPQGGVQLRLDAIDALETHYTPPASHRPWHQDPTYGDGAATALLSLLGFSDITRNEHGIVTAATPPTRPGAILTKFADKYGRAVAMAFPDGQQPDADDGASVYLGTDLLTKTVNFQLLATGWVYPTFYSQLFYDLRAALADTTVSTRATDDQIWAVDQTTSGFTLESRDQLTGQLVIMPKLFRRLAEYLALDDTGGVDLSGFKAFLQAKADRLFTIPHGQATQLDTLIDQTGQTLRLTLRPEQIIFIEG